jgi:M6 family metalloprotease-like protein
MATPFMGKKFTFTQPDGTEIEVRGWGDQHYAVFETMDGYTLVENPETGFFEIAQVSADGSELESAPGPAANVDGQAAGVARGLRINRGAARARGMEGTLRMGGRRCDQRREERQNIGRAIRAMAGPLLAPPRRETVGDFVGLCLLIDFPDEHGTIPRNEVEKFCNEIGYSGFGNNGSVHDYFKENSIGRCRYTNVVAEYYRAQHPKSHYTNPAIPQGTRARQLIIEAIDDLKANGFDFSQLTADNNGFVYAMNVYYAGEVVNNWGKGLWPHAWHLAEPVPLLPGKSAFDYQFTDMSQQLSLGTFCHENGHMLCDYPDLYDYGPESAGAGAFCLMCAGGNINEKNPTHISAYLKRLAGWAKSVTPIEHGQNISLTAGENEFAMFAKDTGEYFIVENRIKAGRDISLPDQGLAIWHVDEEGDNSHEQMTPNMHYELSLEQADGDFDLETSPHNIGDTNDLYGQAVKQFSDSTTPSSKWWDGTPSNLDIYEVSAPQATVQFKTKLFQSEDESKEISVESRPALEIPDNRPQGITDTITIEDDAEISSVKVSVDITHTYRGDLQITLFTPWGDGIRLHSRHQGGGRDNIDVTLDESDIQTFATMHGHSTKGTWGLMIQDLARVDVGILNRWALEFVGIVQQQGPVVLEEAPGTHIPDKDPAGIQRSLSAAASGDVGSMEVSVDITHTWISDLQVSLSSPAGTDVILHDETGGNDNNIIKTYTVDTTPALGVFTGESINGEWKFNVSDHAGQDVGKLNNWKVVIHPAS